MYVLHVTTAYPYVSIINAAMNFYNYRSFFCCILLGIFAYVQWVGSWDYIHIVMFMVRCLQQ